MDLKTAHILTAATKEFYAHEVESFSSTRIRPWMGWSVVIEELRKRVASRTSQKKTIQVLDIGAGNLRFERYLKDKFPGYDIEVVAIDNCPDLTMDSNIAIDNAKDFGVEFIELDINDELGNGTLANLVPRDRFDVAVAFGVMHHIPFYEWRLDLLKVLQSSLHGNGIAAISFWQFERSARLMKLAQETTKEACCDLGISIGSSTNDFMLGWQNKAGIYRYCHNFTDDEIDSLIDHTQTICQDSSARQDGLVYQDGSVSQDSSISQESLGRENGNDNLSNKEKECHPDNADTEKNRDRRMENTMRIISDFASERGFLNRYVIFDRDID